MTPLYGRSLLDTARLIRVGEVSAAEVTEELLQRITDLDGILHSFITVDTEGAKAAARQADAEIAAGVLQGPLHGIPVAVKDSIPTRGLSTTANSRVLADWVPDTDADAVVRLREAGAVIIGKTSLNEFGWSVPCDDDLAPPVRNPWNPHYQAIGSSSGSGAAVSAGLVFGALGTDSGGSTRLPAGQMGLIGLKPTRGAIPHGGALTDDLISTIGNLARNAGDAAAIFEALSGQRIGPLNEGVTGIRLGVPHQYMEMVGLEPEVAESFDEDLERLKALGVVLTDVDIAVLASAREATFMLIAALTFASHEETLRTKFHLYGSSARRYLLTGAFLTTADYLRAVRVGEMVTFELNRTLTGLHGLVSPVSPVVTAEAARRPSEHRRGINASFTAPFSLTGWPAIAVPSRVGGLGLPIGFQIAARPRQESLLLRLAWSYGQLCGMQDLCAPVGESY
jgi:aspartyl-tRNA(Asn)/glutamyl-tRNA(Gln) amidotransferase subunit A